MTLFNNWSSTPIISKPNISNFDFLLTHSLITHIDFNYYYLNNPNTNLELFYYKIKNQELATKLNITNIDNSLKQFINELNLYNEIKDVADALIGKISELRGVSLKSVREEFEMDDIE